MSRESSQEIPIVDCLFTTGPSGERVPMVGVVRIYPRASRGWSSTWQQLASAEFGKFVNDPTDSGSTVNTPAGPRPNNDPTDSVRAASIPSGPRSLAKPKR